jgi:hypothetical protein
MGYQKVYGDLEDYAHALVVAKAKEAYFRIATEQVPVEGTRPTRLEDGTIGQEDVKGMRFTANITLTSLGFVSIDQEPKIQGASFNVPKPDTQLVFTAPIAQKDCFSVEDKSEFDKELEANWKSVINEVKKQWTGVFFEGVVSITN